MRLLLDTSVFLWWLANDGRLGPEARVAIAGPDTEVFVSSASTWEIAVKRASGKLIAPFDLAATIGANDFIPLPIEIEHAVAAGELARHHADPFDRMLIAQAQLAGLRLATTDGEIAKYDIRSARRCGIGLPA